MMTQKRPKILSPKKRNSGEPQSVQESVDAAKNIGYKTGPKAQVLVEQWCKKAQANGLIKSQQDFTVCATALISAGIQEADKKNESVIEVVHIEEGWKNNLCVERNIECRPETCGAKSILHRVRQIEDNMPAFQKMMEIIKH